MKLLVVEDNSRLAERLTHRLHQHFTVDIAHNGSDTLEKIARTKYSVILLDLGLPDMDGLSVCREVRRRKDDTPILVLTGTNETVTKVELLDAGADDYMTKPFDLNELRARITALSRRKSRERVRPIITYRDLTIDIEQHKVEREGIEITLRRKEFDILEYLISNQGRILTRDMIMSQVWHAATNSWTSTVDVHIKHLRDKVDRPFKEAYIKTAYGLGYKVDPA